MEVLEWCGRHWFIAIVGLLCASQVLTAILRTALVALTRTYRLVMVSARGWPPQHLDADGDWKPEPDAEEASS